MSSSKLSTRFVIYVVVSLVTHLLELAASGLFCHMLMQQRDLRMPWFSVAAGLLIIPIVAVQLASAVFLLRRKGETSTTCEVVTTACLHVLQLGFISRHFIILKEAPLSSKRTEVVEMMVLRISFAFTSGSTLFLMQIYLLFQGCHEESRIWAFYVSGVTTLISTTWAVSTFRKCLPEPEFGVLLIAWPGTVLRIFWRAGEILARVIAIGLFASLYLHFFILVIGLHWLSMLVCLYIPLINSIDWSTASCAKKTLVRFMISFAHIFAFINTSSENTVFRYTFYYVIFFLENATLIAVWFVQSSPEQFSQNSLFAYIAVISFVASLSSMIIHYKFFPIPAFKAAPTRACEISTRVICNLKDISDTKKTQNAFQSGVIVGQYNTQTFQDSFLDSDLNSTATARSTPAHQQQKCYTEEDYGREFDYSKQTQARNDRLDVCSLSLSNVEENRSSIDEVHNKNCKKHGESSVSKLQTSSTVINTTEQICYHMSQKRPVWLPSGDSNFANQLLTYSLENFDTGETADSEKSSVVVTDSNGYHNSCSSSPVDLVPSSKENNKMAFQVGLSPLKICERNSCPVGSNTDEKLNQQKIPHAPLPNMAWTNSRDIENERVPCCECPHRASDMTRIEHSVTPIPESDLKATEHIISQCLHTDVQRHHRHYYHQHRHSGFHHSVHRSTTMEDSSDFPQKRPHEDLPSTDLKSLNKSKSPANSLNRRAILSSVAYSPSCQNNRRYPLAQEEQNSTSVNKLTLISTTLDQHTIKNNLPQHQMCSDSKNIDYSLAQSERLAVELLKASGQNKKLISSNMSGIATFPTSDPRLTVRVMTSPVEEISTQANEITANTTNKVKTFEYNTENNTELKSRKRKPPDHSDRIINSNISGITDFTITDPGKEICQTTSKSLNRDLRMRINNQNRFSGLAENPDEFIYENLWPTKPGNQLKPTDGTENYRITTDDVSNKSNRCEVYVCSESEDSALPLEVLSSSADCFTASDNDSDVSLEIVI